MYGRQRQMKKNTRNVSHHAATIQSQEQPQAEGHWKKDSHKGVNIENEYSMFYEYILDKELNLNNKIGMTQHQKHTFLQTIYWRQSRS